MNSSQSLTPLTLETADLFKLFRLSHLTAEEKGGFMAELLENAFEELAVEEIPKYMTAQEMQRFNTQFDNEATKNEALADLKAKIPNLEDLVKARVLALKRDLIQANVEERLELNKLEREKLRQDSFDGENQEILKNQQDRTRLEQILLAINQDDWTKVDTLASPL